MENPTTVLYPSEGVEGIYVGRCPICGSRRFVVHTSKRIFKCYECGEHGPIAGYKSALVVELWPDENDLKNIETIRKNKKGELNV